ncbi:hypothetical protein ZWY2020_002953 [Hordeum vulgare]|nr:hypothetical protein ZWY2020_002953 [Hordeum vulgare]
MSRLARWLAVGGERLDAWRASAARVGAYMALRLAKSWYRNINLGKLPAKRDGSEAELQGMEEELRMRASAVTEYAAWDDFVLEWSEDGGVIAEDLHGLQPYDADGSSDEAGPGYGICCRLQRCGVCRLRCGWSWEPSRGRRRNRLRSSRRW